jgi:hypothetical protein
MFERGTPASAEWRTRAAIEGAIAAGVIVGLLPGPLFLPVAMMIGIVCCTVLCALATHLHAAVGFAYAASLAMTSGIAAWSSKGWADAVYWFTILFFFCGRPGDIRITLLCLSEMGGPMGLTPE